MSDEVDENGHTLGEWVVTTKPTTTSTGLKERTCENCDYKETKVLPIIYISNKTDDENKTSDNNKNVPTGDQTNMGLYLSLFGISGLFGVVLAVFKKKKTLGNSEM